MSWILLLALLLVLGLAFLATLSRRAELARMQRGLRERERQRDAQGQLQHPVVDLSRCLGCGSCVAACPEQGVLELVHGQALVVNGARCVGHAACERECPVGAITVTIANLAQRRDVPVLSPALEALGAPGVFLAGEVTAHALIKTAIEQGRAVAAEVARRVRAEGPPDGQELDLLIVGAGPAGLACALEARRLGLSFLVLEQEQSLGGTVARYPRRKLVLTRPVELPLFGRLERESYTKEELIELWQEIAAEHELPIRCGETYRGCQAREQGGFLVRSSSGVLATRHLCLAVGRRGTPRRLGVPGEELPKVAYSLLDARSYQGRRVLVVGGGDSAVEAALGLAEQPGNEVTLSYRREAFFRLRARNQERLEQELARGRLRVLHRSQLRAIHPGAVDLELQDSGGPRLGRLANDEVFVMVGGTPPLELLERSGVSCDPALRPEPAPVLEQGTGLDRALAAGFALALAAFLWVLWHADYYLLPSEARTASPKHPWLRPGAALGLWFGIGASALIGVNSLYLVRRSPRFGLVLGSLRAWMTSHVVTGLLALVLATLHAAMAPRDTVGGHALLALLVLTVTGAIGRYFYAYVPRAANGRELELDEIRSELERLGEAWDDGQRAFVTRVRAALAELIERDQWRGSFAGRVSALLTGQLRLRRVLAALEREGRAQGLPAERVSATLRLARSAHGKAMAAAHLEDLRAVLGTWRYLHRWVAALMVFLLVLHVANALTYGTLLGGGRP